MKSRKNANPSQRYHDRVSRKYDAMYDDPYWELHDQLAWESIRPHLPRDLSAHCCDLGCGTGKWGARLLKSGFATTFVDHSAGMIEQTRARLADMDRRIDKATLLVADIVDLSSLEEAKFDLLLAMGDPLSICSDAARALREIRRICRPDGIVIATADNKLAATDHFLQRGDLAGLETFLATGRTEWLTEDDRERFELTTFTPTEFRALFERAGFEVEKLIGRTILPIRQYRKILEQPGALDRLLQMERRLAADPASAARAGHLQITARPKK